MKNLKTKLETLSVLRGLLADPVISSLMSVLDDPTASNYAEFASRLYSANGGHLSEYVREILSNSENVYVRTVGAGEPVSNFMNEALVTELSILQEIADLTHTELKSEIHYDGFLPAYATTKTDISAEYLHRAKNIGKFGYGIYAKNGMFYVEDDATIIPVKNPDPTDVRDLIDYERERGIIMDNTRALLAGKPAANILLTGDAGTGKSSTVKAVGSALFSEGLRIIEVRKDQLRAIPRILDELSMNPLKFVLFIDDLSFLKDDDNYSALKAVLEGSVSAKSENVVIYATSNRRHIIKEKFSDREGDDIHRNDTMQETVSLSERFGIHVTFNKPDKKTYLHIVRSLACRAGIELPTSELEAGAERIALERGGRSARLARQYVDSLLAK